jgi:hypothetical protein
MNLLRLYIDPQTFTLSFDVSPWFLALCALLVLLAVLVPICLRRHGFRLVKMNIALGNIGKVEIVPTVEDLQVAHRIWTELVTRKAAIPVDPEHDVIVEVYDSWHAMFIKVRELIGNLPADLVRKEKSTQEIVRISTATLNEGLRPHLTKWQARFRAWYAANKDQLAQKSPQELQKEFPQFNELISDMLIINSQLIAYANELKKLLT